MNRSFVVCLAAMVFASAAWASDLPIAAGPFKPTAESLKQYRCPDWFRDAKFGIWAHWGPQAVPMNGDWYARGMYEQGSSHYNYHVAHYGHPSQFGYKDIIPLWKAEKWEPEKLMAMYKRRGQDISSRRPCTATTSTCGILSSIVGTRSRWVRSVTWSASGRKRPRRAACRSAFRNTSAKPELVPDQSRCRQDRAESRRLLRWGRPQVARPLSPRLDAHRLRLSNDPDRHQEWFVRMKDLVDQYHPDFFYTDGGIPFGRVGRSLVEHLYNSNQANHGGHLEAVYTCKNMETGGEFAGGTCVEDVERGMLPAISPLPWQTDTSNGDWYFRRNDQYKTAPAVIRQLVDIVSKNGNLLLNVVQYPDGSLPPESCAAGRPRRMVAVNGEAHLCDPPMAGFRRRANQGGQRTLQREFCVHRTDIRFTQSKNGATLYAIVMGWPEDGKVSIRSLARRDGPSQDSIKEVSLLGYDGKLEWHQTADAYWQPCRTRNISAYTAVLRIRGVK